MSYIEQKYSIVNESFFGDEVGNDELESSIDSGEHFEKSESSVNEELYFTLVLQTECNYCGDCFTLRQALEYKTPLMSEYSHFLDKIERQMLRILSALDMDDKVIFRYLVRNCTVYDDVFDEMEIFGRNCLVQPCGLDTENMFEIYVYIQKKFIENWKNAYKFLNYLKSLDKFIYCQKFSLGKNCSIYMQFVPVNYTFHQLTEVNPRSIIDISKNKNGSKTKILVERLEPYKRMKNLGIDVKYADILSVVSEDNNDFDRYCMMLNRRNGKQVFGIHFDKLDFSKFNYKLCFFRADCMRVAEKDYKPEWSFGCDRFNDESVCPIENFVQYISNTPGKMFFSYMPPGEDKNDDKPVVLVAFDSTVTGFDGVEYFVMLHSHHMQTDSIEDEFSEENDYSLKDQKRKHPMFGYFRNAIVAVCGTEDAARKLIVDCNVL